MIKTRCRHKSVAIKNKLFVIGGLFTPTYEVFNFQKKNSVILNEIIIKLKLGLLLTLATHINSN